MFIDQIYVFVVADSGPSDEGIPALQLGTFQMPMMGADLRRAEDLKVHAEEVAIKTGRMVELRHFTNEGLDRPYAVIETWGKNPPKCVSMIRVDTAVGSALIACDLWEGHDSPHQYWDDQIDPSPEAAPIREWS